VAKVCLGESGKIAATWRRLAESVWGVCGAQLEETVSRSAGALFSGAIDQAGLLDLASMFGLAVSFVGQNNGSALSLWAKLASHSHSAGPSSKRGDKNGSLNWC